MQLPEEERVNELLVTPPDESQESQESVREIEPHPSERLGGIPLKERSQIQRNVESIDEGDLEIEKEIERYQ